MNHSLQWMSAFYGVLIRLYPRSFRQEFADELDSVFIALARDAASAGPWALLVFCLRELRDFPINLLRTHLEKNPMSQIFNADSGRFMLRGVLAFVVLLVTYNVCFSLIMDNNSGAVFLPSAFFMDYYQTLILLTTWVLSSTIAGSIFSIILGARPHIRWLATVLIAITLPWAVPSGASVLMNNATFNDSAPVKIAGAVLFVFICALLLIVLLKEQPRFRWLTLACMAVWFPQLLLSDVFHLFPIVDYMNDVQIQIQRFLMNLAMGACLAGVFGLLLQNRRKLFVLMIAGALIYMFVDYVFYPYIYFSLLPTLFPMIDFTNMNNLTNEQMAMLSGSISAAIGLLYGLPLALFFTWLQKGKLPTTLQPSTQP